jgi:hypothetical protein
VGNSDVRVDLLLAHTCGGGYLSRDEHSSIDNSDTCDFAAAVVAGGITRRTRKDDVREC